MVARQRNTVDVTQFQLPIPASQQGQQLEREKKAAKAAANPWS